MISDANVAAAKISLRIYSAEKFIFKSKDGGRQWY
jgi:hypothetical protein